MRDDPRTVAPGRLLARAAELFDSPACPLANASRRAGLRGFASGAEWMRLALAVRRGEAPVSSFEVSATRFHLLGLAKYGLAGGVALCWALGALWLELPLLVLAAVPLFYAVEAQSVFLFPLALDGHARPFREARRWTVEAGGTFRVMAVVLPIAATMLGGGLLGRGFIRSWCLGCLAVCLWYEHLRLIHTPPTPVGETNALV